MNVAVAKIRKLRVEMWLGMLYIYTLLQQKQWKQAQGLKISCHEDERVEEKR